MWVRGVCVDGCGCVWMGVCVCEVWVCVGEVCVWMGVCVCVRCVCGLGVCVGEVCG